MALNSNRDFEDAKATTKIVVILRAQWRWHNQILMLIVYRYSTTTPQHAVQRTSVEIFENKPHHDVWIWQISFPILWSNIQSSLFSLCVYLFSFLDDQKNMQNGFGNSIYSIHYCKFVIRFGKWVSVKFSVISCG